MPQIHKKLLLKALALAALINAVLNGFFAWLIVHEQGFLPVKGLHGSVIFDFLLTGVLLGFLMSFLSSKPKVKKALADELPALSGNELGIARLLPDSHFKSALIMAGLGIVVAMMFLSVFVLLGVDVFQMPAFISLKIVFAVLLALLVEYLTTLRCWSQSVLLAVQNR